MLKNWEINRTEEIGFVTPTPEAPHNTAMCHDRFYQGIEELKRDFWREISKCFYFTSLIYQDWPAWSQRNV